MAIVVDVDIWKVLHWLVSVGALSIGVVSFRRDSRRAKFNGAIMREASINTGITIVEGAWFLLLEVVNTGRRPITLTNFSGSKAGDTGDKRILFVDPTRELTRTNHGGHLLNESDKLAIPLPLSMLAPGASWDDLKSFWVEDSHGTRYCLSRKVLKKLKADLRDAAHGSRASS